MKRSISASRCPRGKENMMMSLAAIMLKRHPSQNVGKSAAMRTTVVVGNTYGATLTTASVR